MASQRGCATLLDQVNWPCGCVRRLGLIFVVAYLAVFLFAEAIAFRALIFDTANSELSGVPAIFVTLPTVVRQAVRFSRDVPLRANRLNA